MKRIFTLAAAVVFLTGNVFADQNVLIDFGKLTADLDSGENRQTLMDYSQVTRGASYTDEQRAQLKTSLVLKNWLVELASSSQTVTNNALSFVKEATSKAYFEGPVMGVRVHFPVESFNSWALIKPPFDIPAYDFSTVAEDGTITASDAETQSFYDESRYENGYGVLKNVGAIKSIAVNVYGLNFPHSLSVVFENDRGERKTVLMGYLNFDGWARLTWENPAYIEDLRARTMRLYPLYPGDASYVKFIGFIVQRDAANAGGDFIAYFKDVQVIYDKAVLAPRDTDIDDEATWNIRRERETAKAEQEGKNFGVDQVLRYIEGQKQATETWPAAQAATGAQNE